MLAAKRSAGVAPEVNLRNPLHADNEAAHKWENHPSFETQGRCYQKFKNKGIQEKGLMSFKIFF